MTKTNTLNIDAEVVLGLALKIFIMFPVATREGRAELMPDGRFRLRFSVSGHSADRAKQLAKHLMTNPKVIVNYFGVDINKN